MDSLDEKLCRYRNNWLQHVRRMEGQSLSKQMIKYPLHEEDALIRKYY
jgi:hypothetical protein